MRSGIVLDFCKSLLYLALKKKKENWLLMPFTFKLF